MRGCSPCSLVVLAVFVAASCARPIVLPASFPKEHARSMPDVLASLEQVPLRNERPIVVGVTGEPSELFAWDPQVGLLWKHAVHAASAPQVAGSLVVTHEGNAIVARDLPSGVVRFRVAADARLIGVDGAGDLSVVVLLLDPEGAARGLVITARTGVVQWEVETEWPAGTPAIVGDSILVPWGTHRVSVLSAVDGTERTRLRMSDTVAGHTFVGGGAAYVAQHGWLRVNRALASGRKREAEHYSPVARPIPGQPALLRDSYEPIPPPQNAAHRVRLDWRVRAADRGPGLENDSLYLHFYRFVFALDAERDAVRWLHQREADVVATAVEPGGLFVLDAEGKLAFVDATGRTAWEATIGLAPVVAQLRLGGFAPASGSQTGATGAAPSRPLQEQLHEAARLDDPRLASARAFAVEHLARFEEPAVTGQLLEICDDPGAPELVREVACRELGECGVGSQFVLGALKRRASHLQGVPPPPVGALAAAARTMGLREAVPLLLVHLDDPATRMRDLAPLLEALGALDQRAAVKPIERFVALHHAEPREEHLARALRAGMGALAALRGHAAEPFLKRIADDEMSMPGLGEQALETIAALNAPPPKPVPAVAPVVEAKPSPPPAPDTRPRYLSMQMVAQTLRPAEGKLRACLREHGQERPTARISMVVDGTGVIERVFVSPDELLACAEPLVRAHRFPATQLGRQQVVHVVRAAPDRDARRVSRKGREEPPVRVHAAPAHAR